MDRYQPAALVLVAGAARNNQTEQEYMQPMGTPLTPQTAGAAVVELARADPSTLVPAYLLTGSGVRELP